MRSLALGWGEVNCGADRTYGSYFNGVSRDRIGEGAIFSDQSSVNWMHLKWKSPDRRRISPHISLDRMRADFFHDGTPAVDSARETIPDTDSFCRAKTHGGDCSGDETKDHFWVLRAGWKSGGELYLYDIHTPKKSSLNENLSFHFWKITLSEFNKLSREGKFMASVVSTFLRWGNICCCV